jgi:HEAT repeat protein
LEDGQDPEIQIEAIRTISKIGGAEKETPEILIPKLTSSVPKVREEAVQAFVGYANPWNYKSLWELVFDESEKTRRTAMFAAGRFVNESDLDVLNRAAESRDVYVKEYAKKLLEHLQKG